MRACIMPFIVLALLPGTAVAQATPEPASHSDVVVTGTRAQPSGWREASTQHVVVLSDGSEAELVRLTRNLERLHFLLSGLLGRPYQPDDQVRIHITLIGDVAEFDSMDLTNKRWQQGPFNDLFRISRYYDPREDGAVMATTRVDQRTVIERTPVNAHSVASAVSGLAQANQSLGAADRAALEGAVIGDLSTTGLISDHDLPVTFGEHAIDVPAESLLYAGYAQHYLQTYFPAAYPRWYLDGFGEIFASFATHGDNMLEFGRSPRGTGAVLNEFGGYPLADVLNDKYLTADPHKTGWTPIHAWLLTHFLFFSDTRRPQLRQYLAARAAGADAATAAAVFGDQKVLARELRAYYGARKPYEQVTYNPAVIDEPVVRRLTKGEAAFIKGRLELGARILVPPEPALDVSPKVAKLMQHAHDDAVRQRDTWLARLRDDATHWPKDIDAQLLLAEAECRSGNPDPCVAAAERAAAIDPADLRASVWKGLAMAESAAGAPPDQRAGRLDAARAAIAAANRQDPEAIEPLLAYFQSYAVSGETPTLNAIDGLQKAVGQVPNAPESRLALAGALAGRGQDAVARQIALPVAIGPYDSPERPAAKALVARLTNQTGDAPPAR